MTFFCVAELGCRCWARRVGTNDASLGWEKRDGNGDAKRCYRCRAILAAGDFPTGFAVDFRGDVADLVFLVGVPDCVLYHRMAADEFPDLSCVLQLSVVGFGGGFSHPVPVVPGGR